MPTIYERAAELEEVKHLFAVFSTDLDESASKIMDAIKSARNFSIVCREQSRVQPEPRISEGYKALAREIDIKLKQVKLALNSK